MNRQYHVIAGPYRIARQFAQSAGWGPDSYIIVTRGHQLAGLDPALVASIVLVKVHLFSQRIALELHEAIDQMTRLWPVSLAAA